MRGLTTFFFLMVSLNLPQFFSSVATMVRRGKKGFNFCARHQLQFYLLDSHISEGSQYETRQCYKVANSCLKPTSYQKDPNVFPENVTTPENIIKFDLNLIENVITPNSIITLTNMP